MGHVHLTTNVVSSDSECSLHTDTLHRSYLSRPKDRLLGVADEALLAEQVGIGALRQLLERELPVAAAALDKKNPFPVSSPLDFIDISPFGPQPDYHESGRTWTTVSLDGWED